MTTYSKPIPHTTAADDALRLGGLDRATTQHRSALKPHELGPDTLAAQCKLGGLPEPEREYHFHPTRRWRFDCAFVDAKVAVEIDGATWANGRHTRGSGWLADQEKMNEAAILGWRVIHVTPAQVNDWTAFGLLERILA